VHFEDKNVENNQMILQEDQLYENYKAWKNQTCFFQYTHEEALYYSKEFKGILFKGKNVVEVGFGNGSFLSWARDRGAHVSGVEIIEDYLSEAQAAGYEACKPDELQALNWKADIIVAFDVFEHLTEEQLKLYLFAISKMMRKGGLALLRFPNGLSPFGRFHQHADFTHISTLTPQKLGQFLLHFNIPLRIGKIRRPAKVVDTGRNLIYIMGRSLQLQLRSALFLFMGKIIGIPIYAFDLNIIVIMNKG